MNRKYLPPRPPAEPLDKDDIRREVMKRLEHQNWFIRRALGQRLRNQLKNVPEIQFLLDDSLEYIEHIEQALKED